MKGLNEILLKINRAGMGASKKDAPIPTPAPAPTNKRQAPAPAPTKKQAPAPEPSKKVTTKKVAPPPEPSKTTGYNLRPGEPSNFEKLAKPIPASVITALKKAGVEPGWLLYCPDGTAWAMPHDNGVGSAALVYRAPIRNIFPPKHRGNK